MQFYILVSLAVMAMADTDVVGDAKNVMFTVAPGESTCFLKTIVGNKVIMFEYQVINSNGDFSITFEVQAPSSPELAQSRSHRNFLRRLRRGKHGRTVAIPARRWPAGAYTLNVTDPGGYRFCFDNSFDNHNFKTILFNLKIRPWISGVIYDPVINKNRFIPIDEAIEDPQTTAQISKNPHHRTVMGQFGVPGVEDPLNLQDMSLSSEFLGGTKKLRLRQYTQRRKRGRLLKAGGINTKLVSAIDRFRVSHDKYNSEMEKDIEQIIILDYVVDD